MRLVALASGNGTNLQAVLDACAAPAFGAVVAAVISDRPDAIALRRAGRAGAPAIALPCAKGRERADYDAELSDAVAAYAPDYILLLGWMRILSCAFLSRFPGKVVNLHPALPGTFPGTRAIERALEAYRAGAVAATGVMTHYVPDEGVDSGPVIASAEVEILPSDDLRSLEARVHEAEHRLVIETIKIMVLEFNREAPRRREDE
jgi:phosphoribosylglycinamide formyltransferase-1